MKLKKIMQLAAATTGLLVSACVYETADEEIPQQEPLGTAHLAANCSGPCTSSCDAYKPNSSGTGFDECHTTMSGTLYANSNSSSGCACAIDCNWNSCNGGVANPNSPVIGVVGKLQPDLLKLQAIHSGVIHIEVGDTAGLQCLANGNGFGVNNPNAGPGNNSGKNP